MSPAEQWTVYFDGLCPLCSREIEHYRKQRGAERIRFVDICAGDFNAAAESLDPRLIHKVMHVRDPQGRLWTGVDAFIQIWTALPAFNGFARAAKIGPIRFCLNIGYVAFATIRPWLPRRAACDASPYCERKPQP